MTLKPPLKTSKSQELMAKAKYYLIQGLVKAFQTAMQDKKDCHQPMATFPSSYY
jgi:BTB/POZ domain-containing adapter for CUL3-mediated RhoA degradation protein